MTKFQESSFELIRTNLENIDTDLILIIVDSEVYSLYKEKLNLSDLKTKHFIWSTPSGEQAKTIRNYEVCLNFFLQKGIHRRAHIVAIGGGATSDFAGFIAATILRGINWSIIPTTLLSLVDASIGGKVGINSIEAKNQIGAFHLPDNVFYIHEFLNSLPEKEVLSGKGEIIKYIFLDKKIKQAVYNQSDIKIIITMCAAYKQKIVNDDFQEHGIRKILNLGHTFGHCFEKIYSLEHGTSVVWGMIYLNFILGQDEEIKKVLLYCQKINLCLPEPPWYNKSFSIEHFIKLLKKDKKTLYDNSIDLIISKNEDVEIKQYKTDELIKLIEDKSNDFTRKKFN